MGSLIAAYALVVLLKWLWEALDWIGEQRNGDGASGVLRRWWTSHRLTLAQKGVLHVGLCALWINGLLLGPLNATLGQLAEVVQGDQGIATAPLFSAVTWQTTTVAAAILDSIGKPLAKRAAGILSAFAGGKAAPAGGGGA